MTARLKKPLKLDLLRDESGSSTSRIVEVILYGALVLPGGDRLGKRQLTDMSNVNLRVHFLINKLLIISYP